jgi:hypothetical protein
MCTREEFRRRVGVVDVSQITARAAGPNWGWWRYGDEILCFGKEDQECAVGIIFRRMEDGAYQIYKCWAPGIPPIDDNCIFFQDKDGNDTPTQNDDICSRAWASLPLGSGKMDGITLAPSSSVCNPCSAASAGVQGATLAEKIAVVALGAFIVAGLAYGIYTAFTADRYR